MPAGGECDADSWPPTEVDGSGDGCTWASAATQRVVHTRRLLDMGLITSQNESNGMPIEIIENNAALLLAAFAEWPGHERCCGC